MGKRGSQAAAGIDMGATLAKLAIRGPDGKVSFSFAPTTDLAEVARRVAAATPVRVGLTGAGSAELARVLPGDATPVNEFAAWGAGANELLLRQDAHPEKRYLLVSMGTGTSIMLADGLAVQRVGGTALGGGTLVGLGTALLATESFAELAELASGGDRRSIDLMVSDIYRPGEIALAGDLTAANLGKLEARTGKEAADRDPGYRTDLAHALMALIGENVALVCAGLAAALQVRHVVFGGSTLHANKALSDIVGDITRATGTTVQFLDDGEYAGALGALLLVET